jgi:hypothetical protein
MFDQTVWLSPRATSYTVVCEECAADHGYFSAQVEGRLELDREHSAVTCARGHEIRLERANHAPVGVLSA